MNRRRYLTTMAAATLGAGVAGAAAAMPIVLLVDMNVDPAREKEMLGNYRSTFRPAIRKQPGFVDVKLLKLRTEIAGKAPAEMNYRLLISFQTEELRQKWVATETHQQVWPAIEKTLRGVKYLVLLYDQVA